MADLIELDLVVRDKGLKQSLTTVERLERQIVKAAKAVDQNRISQDRYNKILLQAKREYQTLGVSSQKATAEVRKFAAAQSGATKTTDMLTGAVKKQTEAQMAATKNSNRMGVVTQQAGYQISDFVVQVQSGTSAFVAFGQQASQLVGVLPLMAGSLGISAGAAIALSAALGIIIPIATALGAAFTRSAKSTEDASKATFDYKEATTSASSEIKNLTIESYMLSEGIESSTQAMLDFAIKTQEAKTAANDLANEASILFGPNGIFEKGGGFTILGFEIVKTDEEKLQVLRDQRQAVIEQTESLERQKNAKDILLGLEKAILAVKAQQKKVEEDTAAIQEGTYLSLRRRQQLAEAYLKGGEKAVKEEERLHSAMNLVAELQSEKYNLSKTEIDAILGQVKATYDLEDAVDAAKNGLAAAKEEAILLANALNAAATFSGNLDKSVDSLKARLAEARGEQGAVLALTVSQMEAEARSNAARSIAAGEDRIAAEAQLAIDLSQIKVFRDKTKELEEATKVTKKLGGTTKKTLTDAEKALEEAKKAAEAYAKALDDQVIGAIGGVADAWGDFVVRGFSDFKGFVSSVLNSFKSMLSNMIAMAAKNKIMLSLGIGGVGSGSVASAAGSIGGTAGNSILSGGGMLAGTGVGTALAGISGGFQASLGLGGYASAGLFNVGANAAVASAATGAGALASTIGALAPPLLAVAAIFSFFKKKVKELDSGLQGTITTLDATIESFKTLETKRFWGLSKKVSTETEALDKEAAEPLLEAIRSIQQGVMDAADMFGIASDVFDKFSYEFKLSLKGLSEDEQIQKVNEELEKMGDSFASLTGHFETMNELLEAANQRMQLQNRLDQLLGNNQAILTRQREAELSAMHELNRPLAQAIYDLEDANAAVANAFAGLRASIDKVISDLQSKLSVANEAVNRSRGIFNQLESALSGRSVTQGVSQSFSRREGALSFIRGGDFSDENKLKEALDVVAEPSEDLFGSFVDYARDFARTSITLEEAKKVAQVQLTADEKQVVLLEQQIASAEAQYQTQVDQYNALLGIDTSVKGVTEAIATLAGAINGLAAAQEAAKAAAQAGAGANAAQGVKSANAAGAKILEQLGQSGIAERASDGAKFQKVDIRGTQQLLDVAKQLGVQTSGQTGAQIQQAISNASNLGVSLDKSTRAKQFAMGGYHTGGLRMVGERGPELEATGPSRIFSHNQTSGMFRDPDLKDAVRSLKEEVSGLRTEQRQIQMDISKYTRRSYDIERKWDVDGLPATRT